MTRNSEAYAWRNWPTTFWESFPEGNLGGNRYPTRSYCHAWSSSAAYAFSRYVLGVRFDEAGGNVVTATPRIDVLKDAAGVVPLGEDGRQLAVRWQTDEWGIVRLDFQLSGDANVRLALPDGWKGTDDAGIPETIEAGRPCEFSVTPIKAER